MFQKRQFLPQFFTRFLSLTFLSRVLWDKQKKREKQKQIIKLKGKKSIFPERQENIEKEYFLIIFQEVLEQWKKEEKKHENVPCHSTWKNPAWCIKRGKKYYENRMVDQRFIFLLFHLWQQIFTLLYNSPRQENGKCFDTFSLLLNFFSVTGKACWKKGK